MPNLLFDLITGCLNATPEDEDQKLSLVEQYLKDNPQSHSELNESGELPLGVAIRARDLRLVKTLIKYGANPGQLDRNGESALRIATKGPSIAVTKILIAHCDDPSSGFNFKADFKRKYSGLYWYFLPILACIFGLSSSITFLVILGISSLFFPLLVILSGFMCAGIIIAITYAILDYDSYITAPGYLGTQQKTLIVAIEQHNLLGINSILAENINWLFAPVTLFHNTAFTLLASSKSSRANLIRIFPQIVASESALNHLMSSKTHLKLLSKHPELLRAFINMLSTDLLIKYVNELSPLFLSSLQFFKKNSASSTFVLAKLTDAWSSTALKRRYGTSFIQKALAGDQSAISYLAQGYIARYGLYGCVCNEERAVQSFNAVDQTNTHAYVMAQSELGRYYTGRLKLTAGSDIEKDTHWIKQFFTGISHLNNAVAIKTDGSSKTTNSIQSVCKEYLADLDDKPEEILEDLEHTDTFDWKTADGETPIVVAAKAGHWRLVKAIANKVPASEINGEPYAKALLLAVSANETEAVETFIRQGAFACPSIQVEETGNGSCHEAIRMNNPALLRSLLSASKQDLSHQNKENATPIVYAALLGRWDLVEVIATRCEADVFDQQHYGEVLYLAIQARQYAIVQCLMNMENIRHVDANGDSPIAYAAKQGCWDVVAQITELYSTSKDDAYQYSKALWFAIEAGQTLIALQLIHQGAFEDQLYIDPETGNTPLHLAAIQNNEPILKHILQNPDKCLLFGARNKNGETVFALSTRNANEKIIGLMASQYLRFFDSRPKMSTNASTHQKICSSEECGL